MTVLFDHIRAKAHYFLAGLTVGKAALCFVGLCLVFLLARRLRKQRITVGLACYDLALCACLTAILSITLLGRSRTVSQDSVFAFFRSFWGGARVDYYDVLFNEVLFVPLGLLLGLRCTPGRACLLAFLCSLAAETLQLLSARGKFEVADLLFNTLGGGLGAWIARGLKELWSLLHVRSQCRQSTVRRAGARQDDDDD